MIFQDSVSNELTGIYWNKLTSLQDHLIFNNAYPNEKVSESNHNFSFDKWGFCEWLNLPIGSIL